jgi:hypothetical protein
LFPSLQYTSFRRLSSFSIHLELFVSLSLQCIATLYGDSKLLIDVIVFISTRVKSWDPIQRATMLYIQFPSVLQLCISTDQELWLMRMLLNKDYKRQLRHANFIKFRHILLSCHKNYICTTTHTHTHTHLSEFLALCLLLLHT